LVGTWKCQHQSGQGNYMLMMINKCVTPTQSENQGLTTTTHPFLISPNLFQPVFQFQILSLTTHFFNRLSILQC
jgi:hypothetical protein